MNLLADAVSAALIHSLWQNAVVAAVLAIVLATLRQRSANARYAACCAALAVMSAVPVITTAVLYARALPVEPAFITIAAGSPAVIDASSAPAPAPISSRGQEIDWMSWLQQWALPVWLIGVLLSSLRIASAGAHTILLTRRSQPADDALASTVVALAARIGVRRPVAILVSAMTRGPATLGWIRPVILLPPAAALGITPRQLEALLVHELAHIRRHDYLVNLLQMIVETVFFYHPAIWWASRRMRVERELCCDDIVIDSCGDALGYARALARVARIRMAPAEMAMGSSGGPLLLRIQRVLGSTSSQRAMSPAGLLTAVVVMALAVTLTAARAQNPTPARIPPPETKEAVLRGRVLDAGTGRPVPGASVRADYVTEANMPPLGEVITPCPIDDCTVGSNRFYRQTAGSDGRFEIRGVIPGDYFVESAAPGYLQRRFGQIADNLPEVTVNVAAGRTASGIDIRLERAGTVSGRVFSDAGDGIAGVEVELIRRQYVPGGAKPVAVGFAQTEKLGMFRVGDVPPGDYYIRAYVSPAIRPLRADGAVAYIGTLFPTATTIDAAQSIVVASGQDVVGIDFSLAIARLRSVSGRLVDSDGHSLATASVHLLPLGNGPVEMPEAHAAADGQFRIEAVTPGDYMLSVYDSARTRNWSSLTQQISVVDDLTGLVLAAGPTALIEGRVLRDDGESPLPSDVSALSIALQQHVGTTSPMTFSGAGLSKIGSDGTFRLRAGTGAMYLQLGTLRAPWSIKREVLDGADVTDVLFDLRGGTHRLDIVVTDQVGRLRGTVTDRDARAVSNALVVVFPEDRSRWETSRLIRTTFSHGGRYDLDDLPAADYRVVTVTALPRGAWTDPAVLDRLWPTAVPVHLQEGQEHMTPLKVISAPIDLIQ